MKRVAVFGIFDGVHDGHRSLFSQAKKHGEELVVIVGRDAASLRRKGKKPRHSQEARVKLVLREQQVDRAVLGDEEDSRYVVLEDLNPDAICLGYDQDALGEDLRRWMEEKGKNIPLLELEPFEPSVYHNSYRAEGF